MYCLFLFLLIIFFKWEQSTTIMADPAQKCVICHQINTNNDWSVSHQQTSLAMAQKKLIFFSFPKEQKKWLDNLPKKAKPSISVVSILIYKLEKTKILTKICIWPSWAGYEGERSGHPAASFISITPPNSIDINNFFH